MLLHINLTYAENWNKIKEGTYQS